MSRSDAPAILQRLGERRMLLPRLGEFAFALVSAASRASRLALWRRSARAPAEGTAPRVGWASVGIFHVGENEAEHRFDSPRWQATCRTLTGMALLAKKAD